jgi:hypothetical protein
MEPGLSEGGRMQDSNDKRKYLRFEPDGGDFVQIDKNPSSTDFQFQEVALLVDESPLGGFSIACLSTVGLVKGSVYRFKVGKMAPLQGEVVWERILDDRIARYGIRFLE